MITVILKTAQLSSGGTGPYSLSGWSDFKDKWLEASSKLSTQRTFAIDFIERFHTGIHLGDSNISTVNMDEDGMAAALINECGIDTQKVYEVFKRLDEHYNSDSDDIAEIYINKVKKNYTSIGSAIGKNKQLVNLLIKIMDEGFTSDGEQACIDYLKALK